LNCLLEIDTIVDFVWIHRQQIISFRRFPIHICKKTAVYTLVNGGIQGLTHHQKQQKSLKRWYCLHRIDCVSMCCWIVWNSCYRCLFTVRQFSEFCILALQGICNKLTICVAALPCKTWSELYSCSLQSSNALFVFKNAFLIWQYLCNFLANIPGFLKNYRIIIPNYCCWFEMTCRLSWGREPAKKLYLSVFAHTGINFVCFKKDSSLKQRYCMNALATVCWCRGSRTMAV